MAHCGACNTDSALPCPLWLCYWEEGAVEGNEVGNPLPVELSPMDRP